MKMHLRIDEFKVGDRVKFPSGRVEILNVCDDSFTIRVMENGNEYGEIRVVDKCTLYNLLTGNDKELTVLTHNCQQRFVCGQLGSIASRMALDDQQATTIDGNQKGAGLVRAVGITSHIQYYYENVKWINQWFLDRGLTDKGWEHGEDPNEVIDPSSIDLGDDEDITIERVVTEINFHREHRTVDNTVDQKFEEI